jgi:predicted transcriptional regulator
MNEAKAITDISKVAKSRTSSPAHDNSSTTSMQTLPAGAQPDRVLTILIEPDDRVAEERMRENFIRAFETGEYQGESRSFATLSQLFALFTANRWQAMEKLQEIGPSSLRGLARALGRDVKRVHEDVDRLIEEGLIERTDDKKIYVPFEEIRFEASLKIKAA